MRILSLNTWGGRAGKEKLLDFFKKYADTTDIFCLQEIWAAAYDHLEGHAAGGLSIHHANIMVHGLQDISEVLPNHIAYFRPHNLENYGLLMFIHKDLEVVKEGEVFVHKEKGFIPEGDVGFHARNVQFAAVASSTGEYTVMNFHGLWNGKGKGDSEERISQSEKIIALLKTVKTPVVLCGDFNLLPDTQSIQRIEKAGLKNLIKEYHVTSTRTSYYEKPEKYADYVFVSPNLKVKAFTVLPEEVSDHAALLVEVE